MPTRAVSKTDEQRDAQDCFLLIQNVLEKMVGVETRLRPGLPPLPSQRWGAFGTGRGAVLPFGK